VLPNLKYGRYELADPERFFSELGSLHDAVLLALEWNPATRQLVISVDDLYSNFFQLPEYPGKREASFFASDLRTLEFDLISRDITPLRILKFHVTQSADSKLIACELRFAEGRIKLTCQKLEAEAR
jgi:hypothetical protein